MKLKVFAKIVLALVFVFMASMAVQAVTPKTYLYDTKEENGKIISKVIFSQENNTLTKEMKYEFTYHADGKVAEKVAYRWNKRNEQWDPFYRSTFTYNESGEIINNYGMWNGKAKDYSLNSQQLLIPSSGYDTIFS